MKGPSEPGVKAPPARTVRTPYKDPKFSFSSEIDLWRIRAASVFCSLLARRSAGFDRVPFGIPGALISSRKIHNTSRDVRCLRCASSLMFVLGRPEGCLFVNDLDS